MRVPSYRRHVVRGHEYARVTINGKDHMLGEYNSPESHAAYERLIGEYLSRGRAKAFGIDYGPPLKSVLLDYAEFAKAMIQGGNEFEAGCDGVGRCDWFPDGYMVSVGRLPKYNTGWIVAVAKDPRVLIGDCRQQLRRFIMSEHITTPVIDQWLPAIEDGLSKRGDLFKLNSVGCQAWYADFGTDVLDQIVSKLLKSRKVLV